MKKTVRREKESAKTVDVSDCEQRVQQRVRERQRRRRKQKSPTGGYC